MRPFLRILLLSVIVLLFGAAFIAYGYFERDVAAVNAGLVCFAVAFVLGLISLIPSTGSMMIRQIAPEEPDER